ncbi:hypothetical protein PHISCL_00077 [Aspergillus sclerotialis]|uniref:Uncharacterized protein n=1 Tax=Aspergillus sclerotialis TaxID=2070753 RepID=A0A3A2ZWY1_9EURO|nr:hypothetical protein PHISCL_00077 [Aspergillus sclerotialis]
MSSSGNRKGFTYTGSGTNSQASLIPISYHQLREKSQLITSTRVTTGARVTMALAPTPTALEGVMPTTIPTATAPTTIPTQMEALTTIMATVEHGIILAEGSNELRT